MNPAPATAAEARVAGVVVTYFPDNGFADRLAAMTRETDTLTVVDNSADPRVQSDLRALCAAAGVEFVANLENLGLAAALNAGFVRAEAGGFAWAIAFDQDSTPAPGFTVALLATAQRIRPRVAAVGANWHDEARPDAPSLHLQPHARMPLLFRRPPATHDLARVTCVITSGTLFHLSAWRELGGFDERLFLDLVDTEFCLRASRAGRTVAVAAGARLAHRRGTKQPMRRWGRTWFPSFMPPVRLRYIFRNQLRLWRHGLHAPHWALFEVAFAGKLLAEIVLLESDKAPKLRACLAGTWDGVRGRSGKIA